MNLCGFRLYVGLGHIVKAFSHSRFDFSKLLNPFKQRHGEATFKCDYCEHKCHTKVDLENHVRRHLDENAFKCDQCDYSGSSMYALNRHKAGFYIA